MLNIIKVNFRSTCCLHVYFCTATATDFFDFSWGIMCRLAQYSVVHKILCGSYIFAAYNFVTCRCSVWTVTRKVNVRFGAWNIRNLSGRLIANSGRKLRNIICFKWRWGARCHWTNRWWHIFYGNWNRSHCIWTGCFSPVRIVSARKEVRCVLLALCCSIIPCCFSQFVPWLRVIAMVNSISLYEEVEQVFDKCPSYCGNILLGGF